MAKHQGLGRGLDALMGGAAIDSLPDAEGAAPEVPAAHEEQLSAASEGPAVAVTAALPAGVTADENGALWVSPDLLRPNPHQPRQFFDEVQLAELTESVRRDGVLSPIIIEDAEDGSFYIIAGERRTRAARAAGLGRVPVQLRKYSDSRKLEVALIENIQRTDLNPVEEAQAYSQLMQMENITQDQVAQRVGKSRSAVANSVRLLKLPEDMLLSLAAGNISSGHARALLSVLNPADQRALYDRVVGQGLSVRESEAQAQDMNRGGRAVPNKPERPADTRAPDYIAIEQAIRDVFGTKVQLKGDFTKGTLTVEYFTRDDLDRIYNVIVGAR